MSRFRNKDLCTSLTLRFIPHTRTELHYTYDAQDGNSDAIGAIYLKRGTYNQIMAGILWGKDW